MSAPINWPDWHWPLVKTKYLDEEFAPLSYWNSGFVSYADSATTKKGQRIKGGELTDIVDSTPGAGEIITCIPKQKAARICEARKRFVEEVIEILNDGSVE